MKNKSVLILVSSLILGLGWAIRGAFGHEWGAAWAGGLVGIALVGLSKREDWLRRAPILTLLAAIGWGIGGMMSYGIVVGYCKGNDFFNVYYGYAMLVVIGGLYGFFGGGLFALGLETTDKRPIDCARLITEMCVGGFLFWGFFIFQLEWFMTPPRSELWAGCAGAAMALTWFMKREGYHKSFRVALFSALGAGVGFSFGNFIQVIGIKAGIHYNLWNVMEFTLGALGGFGMAYAIFTTNWPSSPKPSKKANWGALMIILMILPFINYIEAFNKTKLINTATKYFKYSSPEFIANQQFIHATFIFLLFTLGGIVLWTKYNKTAKVTTQPFPNI